MATRANFTTEQLSVLQANTLALQAAGTTERYFDVAQKELESTQANVLGGLEGLTAITEYQKQETVSRILGTKVFFLVSEVPHREIDATERPNDLPMLFRMSKLHTARRRIVSGSLVSILMDEVSGKPQPPFTEEDHIVLSECLDRQVAVGMGRTAATHLRAYRFL